MRKRILEKATVSAKPELEVCSFFSFQVSKDKSKGTDDVHEKQNLFDPSELDEEIDDFPNVTTDFDTLVSDEEMADPDSSEEQEATQVEQPQDDDVETNLVENDEQAAHTLDASNMTQRIKDTLLILGDFKARAPAGLSRKECVTNLLNDLCQHYSYNRFMINMLYDLFPKEVCVLFTDNRLDSGSYRSK